MTERIRLDWSYIEEIGKYKVTSSDLRGLCVTAATIDEAQREALAVISIFRKQLSPQATRLASLDFEAA